MGVQFAARMVDSLANPFRATQLASKETWISARSDWIEYFGLTISAHHGITAEALGGRGFETAFQDTCETVGWTVDRPGSATQRFVDLAVEAADGHERELSLKSTAAQGLSETTAHISKLTEAAWIQSTEYPCERREQALDLFEEYCEAVDAIMMLRAFRIDPTTMPRRYQLIEVPTTIFKSLANVPVPVFDDLGPTIDCKDNNGNVVARVSLDYSDGKITVKQIQLSVCDIHAEWELPPEDS